MPHTITFSITLDSDAIQADRTLDEWVQIMDMAHDRFVDQHGVTWDEVIETIALDYLSGGDYGRYVLAEGSTVEHE